MPQATTSSSRDNPNHHKDDKIDKSQKTLQDGRLADLTAAYQASSDFQSNNQDEISKTSSKFASSAEVKAIEEKVKDFVSSSQVLMSVLDDIRKIHPVIDVVVLAFKAVVTLELKRRDNDQKVLVLQVKMQDMMEIFVQLRVIAPNQKESNRGFTVEESLKKICFRIAEDIWSCANLCDSYSKKRLLVKLLKSPIYEARLAGYIQTFVERRTELHTVLGMFTAHKIHSTFSLLENNQEVLKSINNSIQVIFERLRTQTPIEKQIWKLIESKGGLEKCTEDESALTELVKFDLYGPEHSEEVGVKMNVPPVPPVPSAMYPGYSTYSSPGAAAVLGLNPTPSTYQPQLQPRTSTASQGFAAPMSTEMYYGSSLPVYNSSPPPPLERHMKPVHSHRSYSSNRRVSNSQPIEYLHRPESPTRYHSTFATRSSAPSQAWAGYAPATYEYSESRQRHRSTTTQRTSSTHERFHRGLELENEYRTSNDPGSRRDAEQDPPGPPAHEVNQLKQELQLDVDDDLKKNMTVFKRKLDEQQRQLQQIENTVINQGDRVISVVREGPHDRIHDPELRAIWKEMGWKLGVPVQEFVHTLHDYYVAQNNDSAVVDNYFTIMASPAPGSTADDQTLALRAAFSAAKQRAAEKWALKHINIKNIIPLMEVFDGDASGFVSVWEANQVASLRPKDWSFLQWLAYWAAGRHFTIWQYRQKIGAIILQMFKSVEDLIPTNRDIVNHYLLGLWAVDQVLCQIVPCTEPPDGILAEKIASYTHTEEDIMEQKLKALNYEIDGPDTLGLIIGDSQIERNLLPLIYLLLKFHLMIIRAGSRTVYDREELFTAEETLSQIFDAIFARVDTLYWLFGSTIVDSPFLRESRLGAFAFGMYSAVFRGIDPYYPLALDYGITKEIAPLSDIPDVPLKHRSPGIIEPADSTFHPFTLNEYITGVEGFWSGYLYNEARNRTVHGIIEFGVHTWNFSDEQFSAIGSYSQGMLSINGSIRIHGQQGTLEARLLAHPDYDRDQKWDIVLRGTLDIVRNYVGKGSIARSLPPQYTMSGDWGTSNTHGTFYFSQTPTWVHQFRLLKIPQISSSTPDIEYPQKTRPPSRARLLWKFACNAVLHQVYSQKGLFRTETVRGMLTQLRRGIELARYQYMLSDNQPMSVRDQEEMKRLLTISSPWMSRFCRSVARCRYPSSWGALHFYSWCSMCSGIILGNRYYCITCAEGTYVEGKEPPCDFCSTCRHEHDTEHPWHVLIKMKAFNHNRHSRPLSERINDLRFRPIASPPSIAVPVSPTEGRSDSSGDNKYYESDLDIPRSKKASDRDAISKRVRFSINAFRLSSSSAPSSAKEHDDSFQSGFRHQRRVSSTASGTPGLGLLGILHSGRSNTPNSTNSITAVDHSELNAGEGKVKSSTKANQLQRQCVSCNSEVNLELENYWSCIICSDPHTDTYVVVCSECERRDRGLYVPSTPTKATTQTNRQAAKEEPLGSLNEDAIIMNSDNPGSINPREEDPTELNSLSHDYGDSNNSLSHEVGHPIMQAYQTHPPVVHGPSSRTPSPMFQNISGSRSARFDNISDGDPSVSSKRQLTLQFVKGMFGAGRGGKSRPKTMLYLPSAASDTDDWQKLANSNLRQGGLEEEAEGKLDNNFFYYIL